jgi:hypothetical protein
MYDGRGPFPGHLLTFGLFQQLRQLGDIRRDPPRFDFGEQLGRDPPRFGRMRF